MRIGVLELAAIVAAGALIVGVVYELAAMILRHAEARDERQDRLRILSDLATGPVEPRNDLERYNGAGEPENGSEDA